MLPFSISMRAGCSARMREEHMKKLVVSVLILAVAPLGLGQLYAQSPEDAKLQKMIDAYLDGMWKLLPDLRHAGRLHQVQRQARGFRLGAHREAARTLSTPSTRSSWPRWTGPSSRRRARSSTPSWSTPSTWNSSSSRTSSPGNTIRSSTTRSSSRASAACSSRTARRSTPGSRARPSAPSSSPA